MKKIILASNSPRRKEILAKANIDFTVIKSNYKEESFKFYNENFIKKNSLNKALDVARRIDYTATIIGADTMVILKEGNSSVCLLKPQNYNEAFSMLKNLSGKTHKVVTSISLVKSPSLENITEIVETFVNFRVLEDYEIKKYIEMFNPLDKAGSYGIQDFLTAELKISSEFKKLMPNHKSFIEDIDGDYFNVMGISSNKLKNMLEEFYL